MLIMLLGFLLCAVIGFLATREDDNKAAGIAASIIALAIWVIIIGFLKWWSYGNYVDDRVFFDATREQYTESVRMYKDYALLDVNGAAWTDLKYQGYQENAAAFIKDLRGKVVEYNESILSKRVVKKNIWFNWFITVPDDDMVVIRMKPDGKPPAKE